MAQLKEGNSGYILLLAVLVVGAVGLAITVSLVLSGLSSSRTSFSIEQSGQAKALANACAEEALQQIKSSNSFAGSASLALGQGICSYTVTNTGGNTRQIVSSSTVGTIYRRLTATVSSINPLIVVSSWQENQ